MNSILINKIKNAFEGDHPIDTIKEVISEYEELQRLAKWRNNVLSMGDDLVKQKDKLDEVEERLIEAGYYIDIDIDSQVKEYFFKLNKIK